MFQLFAFFRPPGDADAFDRAYTETHLPLARKIPGVKSIEVSRLMPNRAGASPYYQVSILTFESSDAYRAAMKSPQNAAAGENLNSFAAGLVDFYTAEKVV